MSSWTCPECGTGFPEHRGKKRVSAGSQLDFGDMDSRLKRIAVRFALIGFEMFQTYYEIHCPHCGYVLMGEDE